MLLQFKNSHIFFALESIWPSLNYKFKYLIHQAVAENPDDEYIQELDVPEDVLIQVFGAVTVQPEGVAAFINQELLAALMPQIMEESNLEEALQSIQDAKTFEPTEEQPEPEIIPFNEAARILLEINKIDESNRTLKAAKIARGKAQILA